MFSYIFIVSNWFNDELFLRNLLTKICSFLQFHHHHHDHDHATVSSKKQLSGLALPRSRSSTVGLNYQVWCAIWKGNKQEDVIHLPNWPFYVIIWVLNPFGIDHYWIPYILCVIIGTTFLVRTDIFSCRLFEQLWCGLEPHPLWYYLRHRRYRQSATGAWTSDIKFSPKKNK